jgi:hypothetical protein
MRKRPSKGIDREIFLPLLLGLMATIGGIFLLSVHAKTITPVLAQSDAGAGTSDPAKDLVISNSPDACAADIIASPTTRTTIDREDDNATRYQVHVLYVIPKDGVDRRYDTNGAIARSVSAWQYWLCQQTGGRVLKLDTKNGLLDITFVRLNATNATIMQGTDLPYKTNPNNNPYVLNDLEIHLKNLGFTDPHNIYAIYYDGTSNYSCGAGDYPPTIPGHFAANYLRGGTPGYPPCQTYTFTTDPKVMTYTDFVMLHEVFHTIGLVASCAPHYQKSEPGGVKDSVKDFMYYGNQVMDIASLMLDVNHDDYYKAGIPGCVDLTRSVFLTGGGTQLPPQW